MNSRSRTRFWIGCIFALLFVAPALGPVVNAEDGIYVLERVGGLQRIGNAPVADPPGFNPEAIDFEITEDGRGLFGLDATGQIYSEGVATSPSKPFDLGLSDARRVAVSRLGYAVLDSVGRVHFGDGQPALNWEIYFGWDIARDLELTPEGDGLVVLDGYGGLYPVGEAPEVRSPFFGWDIARDVEIAPNGDGYYILDGFGNIHSAGSIAPFEGPNLGWDIARDLELSQSGNGFYVLDGFGGLHTGGDAVPFEVPFFGWDVATDLELSPQPLVSLTGRVLTASASGELEPIPYAYIVLTRIDLPEEIVRSDDALTHGAGKGSGNRGLRARSNRDGVYVFKAIPAGNYRVEVSAGGFESFSGEVEVLAGVDNYRDFILAQPGIEPPADQYGAVQGTVAEDTGPLDVFIPIPNARVSLVISNRQVLTTRTNEHGEYEFPRAPVGRHGIEAKAEGFEKKRDTVEVEAEQTSYVSFQLVAESTQVGRVYGIVWSATTAMLDCGAGADCVGYWDPVPGAQLHLIPADAAYVQNPLEGSNTLPEPDTLGWFTESGDDGRYEFNDIPLGKYILIVRAEGYVPARRYFELGRACRQLNLTSNGSANQVGSGGVNGGSVESVNLGEWEPGYQAAADYARRAVIRLGLVDESQSPLEDEWADVRAEVHSRIQSASCPIKGILGGAFRDEGVLFEGHWFSFSGEHVGWLSGNYTPQGDGGVFSGEAGEKYSANVHALGGEYTNGGGWGGFKGDWEQMFPDVTEPPSGRLFGLWRRFTPAGGYFIGLWTNCTVPCYEKEVNVRLIPLVQDYGSIHGKVSAITDGAVLEPIPGAAVHAIPLDWSVVPGEVLPIDDLENLPDSEISPESLSSVTPTNFHVLTDENGDYRFDRLPAGHYKLVVSARGFVSEVRYVYLPPNEDLEENFILEPIVHPTGRIEGYVVSASPELTSDMILSNEVRVPTSPIAGAVVMLIPMPRRSTADAQLVPVEDALIDEIPDVPDLVADMETSRRVRIVTTAADGSYAFENVPVGRYLLKAKARGYYPKWQRAVVLEDQTTTVNFRLVPKPPLQFGSLEGLVSDAVTGDAIARAVVTVWPVNLQPTIQPELSRKQSDACGEPDETAPRPWRTKTNQFGKYRFPRLPVGLYRVTVRARDYEPAAGRARIEAGQTSVVDFALRPQPADGSVVGCVRERTNSGDPGDPIPGALVTLIPWDVAASLELQGNKGVLNDSSDPAGHIFRTRTNRRGWYEFPEVPAGRYLMRVQKVGYHPARRRIAVPPGQTVRQNFALIPVGAPPTGTIVGTVYALVEGGGEPDPIPGAFVFLFTWQDGEGPSSDGGSCCAGFTRTNQDGEYEFDDVRVGHYLIFVFASGYEIDFRTVEVQQDAITQANFFLTPYGSEEGGRILGQVTDTTYPTFAPEPIPNVNMLLYALPEGMLSLSVSDLTDPSTIPFAPLMSTWTNEEGYYEFEGLPGGSYLVFALKPNYAPGAQMVELPPNEEQRMDFQLQQPIEPETCAVEGKVFAVLSGGSVPLAGASVTAYPVLPTLLDNGGDSEVLPPVATFTNERGRYRLESLQPGAYQIRVEKEGYQAADQEVTLEAGETKEVDFRLGSAEIERIALYGVVETLSDENGDGTSERVPVPGALIIAHPQFPYVMGDYSLNIYAPPSIRTDAEGRYELEILFGTTYLPGEYRVTVQKEGFASQEVTLVLENGDIEEVSFLLEPSANAGAAIYGVVETWADPNTDSTTSGWREKIPVEGASVFAHPTFVIYALDGTVVFPNFSTRTNEEGRYRIESLPAGQYLITVDAAGFLQARKTVTLWDGAERQVNFVLQPGEEAGVSTLKGKVVTRICDSSLSLACEDIVPVSGAYIGLSGDTIRTFAPIETETDENGYFEFTLPPDGFTMVIEMEGFKPLVERVMLIPGKTICDVWELVPLEVEVSALVN